MQFNWRNWPLAVKLTLMVTTMVIVAVGSVTLLSIRREQQTFRTELKQQAQLLLNTVETTTSNLLYYLDSDQLSDIMEMLGHKQNILTFGRIYDSQGRIIADAYDETLVYIMDTDPFGQRLLESQETVFEWLSDQYVQSNSFRDNG